MHQSKFAILVIIFLTNCYSLAAANRFYLNKLNFCKLTAAATNDYEPENFATNNNLLRQTGQQPIFCGEKIIIRGRVLDENCAPVSDAKIYMWQAGCKGKYPYTPLKNRVNQSLVDVQAGMTFTGNGSAMTNNLGEFYFVTVYPGGVHGIAPHINIRVSDRRLGHLQTRIILKQHKIVNPTLDATLNTTLQDAALNGTSIYNFDIVLPGVGTRSY